MWTKVWILTKKSSASRVTVRNLIYDTLFNILNIFLKYICYFCIFLILTCFRRMRMA